jgi:hypothetical protein
VLEEAAEELDELRSYAQELGEDSN